MKRLLPACLIALGLIFATLACGGSGPTYGGNSSTTCQANWDQGKATLPNLSNEDFATLTLAMDWPEGSIGDTIVECLRDGWLP